MSWFLFTLYVTQKGKNTICNKNNAINQNYKQNTIHNNRESVIKCGVKMPWMFLDEVGIRQSELQRNTEMYLKMQGCYGNSQYQ